MLIYKLKKIFREKGDEVIISTLLMSALVSFLSFISFLIVLSDDINKTEKKQLILITAIFSLLNFAIIYFVYLYFAHGIILSIFLGYLISFCIFVIPSLLLFLAIEVSEVKLSKEEIRDAKLDNLFRKLF